MPRNNENCTAGGISDINCNPLSHYSKVKKMGKIVIVTLQAGGKGDLVFGVKVANHFLRNHGNFLEKIYYINAIPVEFANGFELHEFDSNVKFENPDKVSLIHYPCEKASINNAPPESQANLGALDWNAIDGIIIGPAFNLLSKNKHSYDLNRYLRFECLKANWDSVVRNKTPVILMNEYSYYQTGSYEQMFKKNNANVKEYSTGFGRDEHGIFVESYGGELEDLIAIVSDGIDKQINDWAMSEGSIAESYFLHIAREFHENATDMLEGSDCISLFYDSNNFGKDFSDFYELHRIYADSKGFTNSLIIAVSNFNDIMGRKHRENTFENQKEEFEEFQNVLFLDGLNFQAFQACYALAKEKPGLGACTGDQSLSDTISAGLIPIYYLGRGVHKRNLAEELSKRLSSNANDEIALLIQSLVLRNNDNFEFIENAEHIFSAIKTNMNSIRKNKNLYLLLDHLMEELKLTIDSNTERKSSPSNLDKTQPLIHKQWGEYPRFMRHTISSWEKVKNKQESDFPEPPPIRSRTR